MAQIDGTVIRDFFTWLSADQLTYQKDLERALSFRHPGTCTWIENSPEFKSFCSSSQNSAMWLHGKAGCGVSGLRYAVQYQEPILILRIEDSSFCPRH